MGKAMLIIVAALALLGLSFVVMDFFFASGFLIVLALFLLIGSVVLFGWLGLGIGWTLVYGLSLGVSTVGVIAMALNRIRHQVALKEDQQGFQAADLPSTYIGQLGIAISDLKPSGYICIGDEQLHAMAEGTYVRRGASVQVIEIRGATLIIKIMK